MRHARLMLACAIPLLLLLGSTPASAAGGSRMLNEVNTLRASHGVAPLARSAVLSRTSRRHSNWMLGANVFAHTNRRAHLARKLYGCVGEVLSWHTGRHPGVTRTVRAWRKSPSHLAVLVDARYSWLGAGRGRGVFQGAPSTMWTVQVGCSKRG